MKNTIFSFLLLSFFSILEMSCAQTKNKALQIEDGETPLIVFSKGKCRGFCPAFTLKIYKNNKVEYIGVANVKVLGEKKFELKEEDVKFLRNEFEVSNFKELEKEYLTKLMDFPKIIISYQGYQVDYHERSAPKEIIKLSKLIEKYLPDE